MALNELAGSLLSSASTVEYVLHSRNLANGGEFVKLVEQSGWGNIH